MVKEMYGRIMENVFKDVESSARDEGEGEGRDPLEPLSPPSSSSSESEHSSHKNFFSKNSSHTKYFPLLKLDVKFDLPVYDEELHVEKLDNRMKQIEVHCRVHKIMDETTKILLGTLRLGGTALVWCESRTQADIIQDGKIIPTWIEFTVVKETTLSISTHTD